MSSDFTEIRVREAGPSMVALIVAWFIAAVCIGVGIYVAMMGTNWLLGGSGLAL